MKLFVTGALGNVARIVVPQLPPDCSLVLTDREEGEVAGQRVEAVSVLDFGALSRAMQGCDAVLHLAIASGRDFVDRSAAPDAISAFDEATIEVNTRGAYYLFEAAARAKVRRVLLMSSLTVFLGHRGAEQRAQPALAPRPNKLYAVTKLFGEELGAYYHRAHGLEVITMRLGQPYPLGTHHDEASVCTVEGRQTAVHREDLASGVIAALVTPQPYAVFNLVSRGEPYGFDLTEGEKIGYTPRYSFGENGVQKR